MAGSVLIWAPPGRGRRVPGPRNGLFWPPKNPGACFWGRKKPLREWPHALPSFRAVLFWLPKSPCGHGDTHSLGCPAGWDPFTYDFTFKIKYLGKWSNLSLQSSPGFEPGASGVRRPRARPLGNLTTVGHLAKVSLDLSTHFQTRKTSFSDT